jgi:hypothetical protein
LFYKNKILIFFVSNSFKIFFLNENFKAISHFFKFKYQKSLELQYKERSSRTERESYFSQILELQSFRRKCEDKDMAAMLDDITKDVNEKYFVNVLQHGGDDVTCSRRISPAPGVVVPHKYSSLQISWYFVALHVAFSVFLENRIKFS